MLGFEWHDPALWLCLAAWGLVAAGVAMVARFVWVYRMPGKACRRCGYDLSGSSGVCPECGSSAGPRRRGRRRVSEMVVLAALLLAPALSQRWWRDPAADWMWNHFPPQTVEVREVDGLEWRIIRARGPRGLPRTAWWGDTWQVKHPSQGWIGPADTLQDDTVGGVYLDGDLSSSPQPPRDVTGDGVPEHFVESYSGGAHCCSTFYVVNVALGEPAITRIDGSHSGCGVEDVDRDGVFEIVTADRSFAYWKVSYVESPAPRVVLTMRGGRLTMKVSAMRAPAPSDEALRQLLQDAKETAMEGGTVVFWGQMLDLLYSDNAASAWRLLELAVPNSEARAGFRAEFEEVLEGSPWWKMYQDELVRDRAATTPG